MHENVGESAVLRALRVLRGHVFWLRHGCDVLSVSSVDQWTFLPLIHNYAARTETV